jgi:hypothetical protein
VRKLTEGIETPRGEKRGYIRLKPAIVAQHGDCAEKRCRELLWPGRSLNPVRAVLNLFL